MVLFNPTIPQSVPRSNNLTSSPDKRGFPTRNAASPLSSYLSCLLSHHITKNTKTTLTNTTSQHNTARISSLLLSFLLLHHAALNNTQQPQEQHWQPKPQPQQHTKTQLTTKTKITLATTTSQKTSPEPNYFHIWRAFPLIVFFWCHCLMPYACSSSDVSDVSDLCNVTVCERCIWRCHTPCRFFPGQLFPTARVKSTKNLNCDSSLTFPS